MHQCVFVNLVSSKTQVPAQLQSRLLLATTRDAAFTTTRPYKRLRRSLVLVQASKKTTQTTSSAPAHSPTSAKDAVETGMARLEAGDVPDSIRLFEAAMQLNPSTEEARAAVYNKACAHAKRKEWQQAADLVVQAVNVYNLKLDVAVKDPDLEPLRERREWVQAVSQAKGGVSDEQFVKLRSELKAPFRLFRITVLGGLTASAAVGLLIIITRLVGALRGGEGAPDLQESLQNFAINSAALAALSFFLSRDLAADQRDKKKVEVEESLARLQVALGEDRVVPLAAFRGSVRPVVVAGSKGFVQKALRAAEPLQQQLRERGVSVVPVTLAVDDPEDRLRRLKQEFSGGKGFSAAGPPPSAEDVKPRDRKWQLTAHDPGEWSAWLSAQQQPGAAALENLYMQVQLDGSVRASGTGMPPWQRFVDDLPPLDDPRSKWTDGGGRSPL